MIYAEAYSIIVLIRLDQILVTSMVEAAYLAPATDQLLDSKSAAFAQVAAGVLQTRAVHFDTGGSTSEDAVAVSPAGASCWSVGRVRSQCSSLLSEPDNVVRLEFMVETAKTDRDFETGKGISKLEERAKFRDMPKMSVKRAILERGL